MSKSGKMQECAAETVAMSKKVRSGPSVPINRRQTRMTAMATQPRSMIKAHLKGPTLGSGN